MYLVQQESDDVDGIYKKVIGILLVVLVLGVSFSPQMQYFFSLPSYQKVAVGDTVEINLNKINFSTKIRDSLIVDVVEQQKGALKPLHNLDALIATQPGLASLKLTLFGLIPIKTMQVEIVPSISLVPGGQSIGVLLHSEGVLVVGQSVVEDTQGNKSNPARDAGIDVGDIILKVNDRTVNSDELVARLVNEAGKGGKPVKVLVKHNNKVSVKYVRPVKCKDTQRFRMGLYVRDTAAGVGTVTFYDPISKKYGALGHVITDVDTNRPINIANGKIVRAGVQGIQPGKRGHPGEKIGMFIEDKTFQGDIKKNTQFGIFGTLKNPLQNTIYNKLPVAFTDQIKVGPAEILTVLDGEKIERYGIDIENVMPEQRGSGKGMIIRVTDPKLIRRTGGIIQGMSGSPIIQNGHIVGAVTHVFVNDPTKGYGCLIEWMLDECQIKNTSNKVGWRAFGSPF